MDNPNKPPVKKTLRDEIKQVENWITNDTLQFENKLNFLLTKGMSKEVGIYRLLARLVGYESEIENKKVKFWREEL